MSEHGLQIGAPEHFRLQCACRPLVEVFGWNVFLVGSALTRRDYRDVDVRCILPDRLFNRMFPRSGYDQPSVWSLFCGSMSFQLSQQTGLPIDFQFQSESDASKETGRRSSLGVAQPNPNPEQGAA